MHWSRIGPNLVNYLRWFAESQTPIALLGVVALIVPARRLWPAVTDRAIFFVIGGYVAALWLQYGAYLGFDSWGYLRFLLPSWPLLLIGAGAVLMVVARTGRAGRLVVIVTVATMAWWEVGYASRHGVFDQRQAARHILLIAPLIRANTAENSVVIALQHSGAARYYTGRVTLRYDYLPADTLDRDLDWLQSRGVSRLRAVRRARARRVQDAVRRPAIAGLARPAGDRLSSRRHVPVRSHGTARPARRFGADRHPRRAARPFRLRATGADAADQTQVEDRYDGYEGTTGTRAGTTGTVGYNGCMGYDGYARYGRYDGDVG